MDDAAVPVRGREGGIQRKNFFIHPRRFGKHVLVEVGEGDQVHDRQRQRIERQRVQGRVDCRGGIHNYQVFGVGPVSQGRIGAQLQCPSQVVTSAIPVPFVNQRGHAPCYQRLRRTRVERERGIGFTDRQRKSFAWRHDAKITRKTVGICQPGVRRRVVRVDGDRFSKRLDALLKTAHAQACPVIPAFQVEIVCLGADLSLRSQLRIGLGRELDLQRVDNGPGYRLLEGEQLSNW